ncbi:MAG: glycosyltransferase family 39 protein [Lacunisphaera sp.]
MLLLFCGLLAFNAWGASVGWKNLNLPGVEFRQTQTAISALFIQRDHDFSLAYPTPVLGKPWSVPMEFPLYQWSVVLLSNRTGLDLTKSGRAVSLACFYLTLPAVFLLLAAWVPDWRARLLVLCVVLGSPFYIFYSRAFLMETMALMASVWFLVGYVRALKTGRWTWLLIANIFGAVAGLVKVTTFMLYLAPAAVWTGWLWWRCRSATTSIDWARVWMIVRRGLIATTVPFVLTLAWLDYSDAIKALNPAGQFLLSSNLTGYLLGTVRTRFSPEIWRAHWQIMFHIVSTIPLLIAGGLFAVIFGRGRWGQIVACLACFIGVQLLFPELYAWHEYYYAANTLFLLVAFGLVLIEISKSRLPRPFAWLLVTGFLAVQAGSYFQVLFPIQRAISIGGSPITQALRLATEPDDVLIVAGQDWCPNTPYFAQRRALMFRHGIERDGALIGKYFAGLKGETVGALVLAGDQRNNRELLDRAVKDFNIDPRPVFTCLDATVYFNVRRRLAAIPLVQRVTDAQSVHLTAESIADAHALQGREVDLAQVSPSLGRNFKDMSPRPYKYYATFGVERQVIDGRERLFSHPETRLWFRAAPGEHAILIEALLSPAAYADSVPMGDRTDGIDVTVSVEGPDRTRRLVFSRNLNPRDVPADRGLQTITGNVRVGAGESVVVGVGPGPHKSIARDWAMLGRIEIK